mgnify:CR=1 FL=1|jgi:hypothetical protein
MYDNYLNDNSDFIYNNIKNFFDNIKEFINFDIIIYLILVYLIYIIILRNKESYNFKIFIYHLM